MTGKQRRFSSARLYHAGLVNASQALIRRTGHCMALLACATTVAYVVVQLLQVAHMVASPLDGILIFGTSLAIVLPFLMAMLALHYVTPEERKFWSHAALIFALIYAVFVTANYVVQLATVIPAEARGNASAIELLRQTPHSMFWDFDALGYIFMGLSNFAAMPALLKVGPQRRVRFWFGANALVTPLISIVYFYPVFSEKLLMVGAVWGITAPMAMFSLARMFRDSEPTAVATVT